MFLDAEQSVCHFICNFAVASPPPKGQGTHFGQQQLQIKKYEYKHIPDHGGDMPKHPPHSKNMGTSDFLAFFKLEDTDLWRKNAGPCWRKGKEKLANVAKWSLNNSTVK